MKENEFIEQSSCICDDLSRLIEDLKAEHTEKHHELARLASDALLVMENVTAMLK